MKFDEKTKKIVIIVVAIIVVIAAIWFGMKVFSNKGMQQGPGGQIGNFPSGQQGNMPTRTQGNEVAPTGEQTQGNQVPQGENPQEVPAE